ncbi:DUF4136 domain-containing protein [Alterisphingorhabdus coralli]|uniref:DUF4136 domain-containing protein n=1 Tax=Alterisphingorhabdus coralli TaxID=3071408 RepID=A0AA97FA72_9SPHN|nr:DUF4136 domain-containing protein [Parasphingorhabdus sp. SCSIO 66989]WOE75340.1 DUF4136 domain-containing protein [Parasphingorhabdus sp. SCSIO 66989]
MKPALIAAFAAVSLSLSGCATTANITTDSDPAQDFSAYRTFGWAGENPFSPLGDYPVSPLAQQQIANGIKSTLEARGYSFVADSSKADFAVSYSVGARDKTRVSEVPVADPYYRYYGTRASWRWGRGYFPAYYPSMATETVVNNYTEGTLSIDIFDVSRRAPVWHGVGTKRITTGDSEGNAQAVQQGVRDILAEFPPR